MCTSKQIQGAGIPVCLRRPAPALWLNQPGLACANRPKWLGTDDHGGVQGDAAAAGAVEPLGHVSSPPGGGT